MRAAIYSRYSSDRQRETSLADQQRNCLRHVEREGWQVVQKYSDKAISGATADRPAYQKMLADAKAERFDVLLIDDLSRLSRDDVEFKTALRRFAGWGVRVIGVSDGYDSAQKGHKLQAGVRGLINDIYLDDLREKTHRGLSGRALAGMNTGGKCYGYKNVPIEDPKRKDEYGRPLIVGARKEIDPEQAEWVRFIFQMYADGRSPRAIAAELNRKGVKSPRGKGWAASAVYGDHLTQTGLLNNQLYIGKQTWNRSRWVKDCDTGKPRRLDRPEAEWIVVDKPELRIVDRAVWEKVKARQAEQREASKNIRAALHHKARTGRSSRYLFSGVLKCECCGGAYSMADARSYACSTHTNRGPTVCSNSIRVPRKVVEDRLLQAIRSDLFTEDSVSYFKREVGRLLRERRSARNADAEQAQRDLEQAETVAANVMAAIRAGILTPSTKAELEKAESEVARLRRVLQLQAEPVVDVDRMLGRAVERFREVVADLGTAVSPQMGRARETIKRLVGGAVPLVPTGAGGLDAELRGDYAGLIRLIDERPGGKAGALGSLVAGAGFEPATFRL